MSWIKYPYRKIPLDERDDFYGNAVLKPIVPVIAKKDETFVIYDALVDSGADFSIFHAEVGEALGLDVPSGDKRYFAGVEKSNGKVGAEAFLHKITISVQGFGVHEIKTLIAFSYDINDNGYGILGQKGFFEHFPVKFDYKKATFEIKVDS